MSTSVGRAPPAEQFAPYPASWYLFSASVDLARGPVSKSMLGRRLVAFRTQSGRAVVMDGNCAHLGADLGCGKIVGETIQCPFHGWRYGTDGICKDAPVPAFASERPRSSAPPFARLQTYPVIERHGYLFFFNGREPLFPLPFFWGEEPERFVAGRIFTYTADCNWYMSSSHAFDTQHFASVHDRELTEPPRVDCPAPFARRNSYHAKVVGQHLLDRLLHRFAGKTVHITISICGGTFALVTADFGGAHSRFMVSQHPLENGQTLCEGLCFAPRSGLALLDRFNLFVRRVFTHGYLKAEARDIRGTQYRPQNLTAHDRELIEFFQWAAALPQSAAPMVTSRNPLANNNLESTGHEKMEHGLSAPAPRAVSAHSFGRASPGIRDGGSGAP
jgi:phenylpropionate dioxygenase-like ring-hydroxylating dioxygenase large terminal subunit